MRKEKITLRLDPYLLDLLADKAREKHLIRTQLIEQYVLDGIAREKPMLVTELAEVSQEVELLKDRVKYGFTEENIEELRTLERKVKKVWQLLNE